MEQGLQILAEIVNERPDAVAERSYAPWIDLEAEIGVIDRSFPASDSSTAGVPGSKPT